MFIDTHMPNKVALPDDGLTFTEITMNILILGFEVIFAGPLKNARYLEPLAGLNIYLGYGAGQGTGIAPTWIRRS